MLCLFSYSYFNMFIIITFYLDNSILKHNAWLIGGFVSVGSDSDRRSVAAICYTFVNHGFINSTELCTISEEFLVTTTQLCVRPETAISPSIVGIDFPINSAAP